MGENSHISWCDHTFNPWIGCAKISPACDGCYAAELMGKQGSRYKRVAWGEPGAGVGERDRTAPSTWKLPRKWNKKAADNPGKTFVFCASLADVFDNAVNPDWRRDLFDLIHATPNLTYLLLTKRPGNIVKLFDGAYRPDGAAQSVGERAGNWPRNAAIGCTIANQEEADRDIPKLLAAKAALRPAFAFLSMEPLLGPVDISSFMWPLCARWPAGYGSPEAAKAAGAEVSYHRQALVSASAMFVDWVIVGGETDQGAHKARCGHPDWFRSLRDQCAAAGVPFHFKQWGEWQPLSEDPGDTAMTRRGKRADPCTIDGQFHRARPETGGACR